MEIPFTPSQEAKISEVAAREGKNPADIVVDATLKRVLEDEHFLAKLDKAIAQADRGEFIEEEEMDLRVARMLAGK